MTPSERAKAALKYQNRKNRAQGAFFEQMINRACDFYRIRQIADIEKTPEPMQPTKDLGGGKFIAHYTSTAQADYKGFLFGGRAVNFEAKYTDVEKMTQDRVTVDQTEALERLMAEQQTVSDVTAAACRIRDEVLPAMCALRAAVDEAETLTASDCWPYPTYGELLFNV